MAMLGNKKAAKVALNISEPRKRLLREVDRLIEEGTLLVSLTAFPMLRRGVGAYMYECMESMYVLFWIGGKSYISYDWQEQYSGMYF